MRKLREPDEICPPAAFAAAGKPIEVAAGTSRGVSAPALRFDWADWLPYLEGEDVPEDQKRELIETLWSIVVSFVDLGWRIDANPETGNALDLRAILTSTETEEEAE